MNEPNKKMESTSKQNVLINANGLLLKKVPL